LAGPFTDRAPVGTLRLAKTINDLFEEGCVFVDGMVQAARGGGWPNPTL